MGANFVIFNLTMETSKLGAIQ